MPREARSGLDTFRFAAGADARVCLRVDSLSPRGIGRTGAAPFVAVIPSAVEGSRSDTFSAAERDSFLLPTLDEGGAVAPGLGAVLRNPVRCLQRGMSRLRSADL